MFYVGMHLPASKILRNPVGSNSFLTQTLGSKCYGHLQMTRFSAMIYPQLASTDCLMFSGVLYLWGQNKPTGEAAMYPKPVQDLSGWQVRSIGCW